jgi:4'-phosphopantetheinyl transferase
MWWHSLGEADIPVETDWLSATEDERVKTLRFTKRRTEWLVARWTAKNALAAILGLPSDRRTLARLEIRSILQGPARGAPEVFLDGVRLATSVSLTDRAGWAVCALAESAGIGCDLELVEPRSQGFVRDFFLPGEQRLVSDPPFETSFDLMANLIWSAKESALKVLRTGLRRDTRSVQVVLPPDASEGGWRALITRAEEGAVFTGWWRQYGTFLLTMVASSRFPPPRPVREPPGLADAVPSHSWMAAPLVADDTQSRPPRSR